jgi:hypothetical protein
MLFARELPTRVRSFCLFGVRANGGSSPKKLARQLTAHASLTGKRAAQANDIARELKRPLAEIARLFGHGCRTIQN